MKLHANEAIADCCRVYLNGEYLKNCFFADEEEGIAHVYFESIEKLIEEHHSAKIVFGGIYDCSHAIVTGKVEIKRFR